MNVNRDNIKAFYFGSNDLVSIVTVDRDISQKRGRMLFINRNYSRRPCRDPSPMAVYLAGIVPFQLSKTIFAFSIRETFLTLF